MLVEDNESLVGLFRVQMRLGRHELSVTVLKKNAFELLEPGILDVVFIDMGLEGFPDRGLEITWQIKAQAPEPRSGVLSSNDLQDMVRKSLQVGAGFYIVKPFTVEGL